MDRPFFTESVIDCDNTERREHNGLSVVLRRRARPSGACSSLYDIVFSALIFNNKTSVRSFQYLITFVHSCHIPILLLML